MTEEVDEQAVFECGHCRVPILTFWSPRGLLRGEYVLAGDVIFHPKCFDEWVEPFLFQLGRTKENG